MEYSSSCKKQISKLRKRQRLSNQDAKREENQRNQFRNYDSVDWIMELVSSDLSGKCIKTKVKQNLTKKSNKHLPKIIECLITDALMYDQAMELDKQKITMQALEKGKRVSKERSPIYAKCEVNKIAMRLGISEPLVWKYLSSMEKSGLIQGRLRGKTKGSTSYLIIGGYIKPGFSRPDEKGLIKKHPPRPIYFWNAGQPDIFKTLSEFKRAGQTTILKNK